LATAPTQRGAHVRRGRFAPRSRAGNRARTGDPHLGNIARGTTNVAGTARSSHSAPPAPPSYTPLSTGFRRLPGPSWDTGDGPGNSRWRHQELKVFRMRAAGPFSGVLWRPAPQIKRAPECDRKKSLDSISPAALTIGCAIGVLGGPTFPEGE